MATALPPRPLVTFSTRGGLGFTTPPSKPPDRRKHGSYCFRATCQLTDAALGCPVGKVKGYDRSPEIGRDTEEVCRVHARTMPAGTFACGEAEVVLLPATDLECTGEVFLVLDGTVKRLV